MQEYYDADFVSLHVRVKNRAALHLYHKTLGFDVVGIEKEYYADREDAYKMRKYFKKDKKKGDKIIEITDDLKFEDVKDVFEDVDENGEEISPKKNEENEKNEENVEKKDENNNNNDNNKNNVNNTETVKKKKKHKKKK